MSKHANLIRRLKIDQEYLLSMDFHDEAATIGEAADALQARDAAATPENLTSKREKVILLTRAQNENESLRAQLATQALRLEDANGLLRYVADQRDAALSKLQAMERKPMTEAQAIELTRDLFISPRWPSTAIAVVRGTEAFHGISFRGIKGE